MAQLGELKKNADKFQAMGVEVIAVFREDKKGVEGLEIIKKKTGVEFTLALDTGANNTSKYSPVKKTFDNYVVDKTGVITKIIEGDLRNRAKSKQLLDELGKLTSSDSTAAENTDEGLADEPTGKPGDSKGDDTDKKKGK